MKTRIFLALFLMAGGLTGCISGGKQFGYLTGPGTNEVFQFRLLANGTLAPLDPPNAAVGSNPVSVLIHPSGLFAYIANFAGNNVTLLSVNKGNGELAVPTNTNPVPSPTPPNIFNTQTGPVALAISPNGSFLYALNQTSGNISAFVVDPTNGNLSVISPPAPPLPNPPPPPFFGSIVSPSSIAISPNGNFLFVTSPSQKTVSCFSIDSKGLLTEVAGSPFAAGASPRFVMVEPSSRFLYVADSASNAVLGFSIQSGGALAPLNGSPFAAGAQPVAMATNPQGSLLYVANQGSNNVSAFVVDVTSGALGAIGGSPFPTGGQGPSFLAASGAFLYVTDQTSNDVAAFSIGSNGGLTAITGSPFNVATSATWITLINE
jgi:6-phosphogluconolactonase